MRNRISLVVVAAVLALTGCRGHEAVTGGYGGTGVTGVVSMAAGMTNNSPQGVRVEVRGTGMSAVLGADGRFSFFGVPENPTLTFSRQDVSASFRVEGLASAPLQIELTSTGASVGRHRVVPSGPLMQIEGLITAIGDADITVHDSHNQDVKVNITTDTAIYKGNQKLQLSDLKVGDRVHVQAKVSGDATNAVVVILQNPDDNSGGDNNSSQTMTANGTVKNVGSGQLTVTTVPKGDVVVKVDDHTIIRKQGTIITLADIHTGDQVNTMGTRIDDHTLQAKQIEVRGVSGHH
jgi:uncharacterized protein DUF5666